MSLLTAIEIIKPRLSEELQKAIANALDADGSDSQITIPGFHIGRVPSFNGLKHTNERRLIGCENKIKEKGLRERLEFLQKSEIAGTTNDLWMGYIAYESERIFFGVDVKRKAFCTSPYP
jgi:hypothetical protein